MIKPDIISILQNKIKWITNNDNTNILVGPITLPVNLDGETVTFKWYSWLNAADEDLQQGDTKEATELLISRLSSLKLADAQQSSVLVYGDFEESDEALIRMHSICHTGDIFGSKRCDCGFQLRQSMKMISQHGSGALFYLANHEGRGIGLFSKAMAYILQEEGYDTVEANLELGFVDDSRDYSDAISVLQHLRSKPVTLITNNPKKLEALKAAGMNTGKRIPLWGDVSVFNEKYLRTKVARSGHLEAVKTADFFDGRVAK
ncbi:GTP cyclohydrolase [Paenibacillus sp. FSL R7-0273]|uniref:GTP cyclohydrolase II n=1 Tax=Paenibacillus sp. FSL R7-0273 TaxID=1536772 RepID=UPI0004F5D9E0|nr:GTP cyclohydrolase II [Paenibacillus sp. FSL R7-0273]AIQ47033.1 GTP cyclohydrolase [Paenibacillus sp. FSL R7-0273]OMF97208.1 GTP cyclohydrolase [Paenibacillus sp. FSL R7-0273]